VAEDFDLLPLRGSPKGARGLREGGPVEDEVEDNVDIEEEPVSTVLPLEVVGVVLMAVPGAFENPSEPWGDGRHVLTPHRLWADKRVEIGLDEAETEVPRLAAYRLARFTTSSYAQGQLGHIRMNMAAFSRILWPSGPPGAAAPDSARLGPRLYRRQWSRKTASSTSPCARPVPQPG
jgi:hypothetical protein